MKKFKVLALAISLSSVISYANEGAKKTHIMLRAPADQESCERATNYLKERLAQFSRAFSLPSDAIQIKSELKHCTPRAKCYSHCWGTIISKGLKISTLKLAEHKGQDRKKACNADVDQVANEVGVLWAQTYRVGGRWGNSCQVRVQVVSQK